ncbi:MAG: site-specific integrase [Pontiellaceae bacterium]|nr:site-specific integrase [Pontiellaceae bacterium]MBN2786482.1 site-specific integrase [Pontiellaceae bacterium]
MGLRARNGFWHYEFMVNRKVYSGNTNIPATVRDKPKAKRIEDEAKAKVKSTKTMEDLHQSVRRQLSSGAQISLVDAWGEYKQAYKKKQASPAKEASYLSFWNDFVAFLGDRHKGVRYMHEVTPGMAEEYMGHFQNNGRWVKGKTAADRVGASTINTCLDFLKRIFRTLHDRAGLVENPFVNIGRVEADKRGGRDIFTEDELKIIAEKSRDEYPDIYHLFMVGLCTGLRRIDVCLLKWSEVNLETRIITRVPEKTKKKGVSVMIPMMIPGFYEYMANLPQDGEYVNPRLASLYMRQYGPNQMTNTLRNFLQVKCGFNTQAKLSGRDRVVCKKGVHSLRHTFVYLAAKSGMPLNIVQGIVGHLNQDMTKFYADHATVEDKQIMMRAMPNYLVAAPTAEMGLRTELVNALVRQVGELSTGERKLFMQKMQAQLA